jgi:threonine synthase
MRIPDFAIIGHMSWKYICHQCNSAFQLDNHICGRCGLPMSLSMPKDTPARFMEEEPRSLWHYAPCLPVADLGNIVSLGEGATPLVDAPRLATEHKIRQLLVKNEAANPTGSFKDRQVSVGISHAREIGADTVAVVSSGNVACATSAYAARAGMKAVLMMHGHAAPAKVALASSYGAVTVQVETPSAMTVFELCIAACEKFGWYHLSTAGMFNPYNVEGAKTIAYEIYHQTSGELPDWIVAPVGGGGLLGGIWRGFEDLRRLGLIKKSPRLAGVQASGCAPLVRGIDTGQSVADAFKDPWPNPATIAGGIADDVIFDAHSVIPGIRQSGGTAVAVDDEETIHGQARLARLEGLLCEPTSAVVVAAMSHLPFDADSRVCMVMTGTGFKDPAHMPAPAHAPVRIAPDMDALAKVL